MSAVPDDFPQLAPHHFDGLRESVRALNGTIARAEEQRARDHRESLAAIEKLTAACEAVAKNLPTLMDLAVPAKTNGHGNHDTKENDNDRRNSDDS